MVSNDEYKILVLAKMLVESDETSRQLREENQALRRTIANLEETLYELRKQFNLTDPADDDGLDLE